MAAAEPRPVASHRAARRIGAAGRVADCAPAWLCVAGTAALLLLAAGNTLVLRFAPADWLALGLAALNIASMSLLGLFCVAVGVLQRKVTQLAESEHLALASGRAKQDFLAAMSHEIRTPMNGVLGISALLMETRLDPEQRRYTQTIQSSAEHLLCVLNDILDFSKIEARAMEFESTPFQLEEEVATVVELFAPAAASKGVEIICRLGDSLPNAVVGDPGRFRQVLLNLVGNAVKFTERGWVEIDLQAHRQGDNALTLEVSVTDTGIGLDPARIPALFERFTQGGVSVSRQYGGTGLGLAISRRLIEAMGGEIRAWVRPGGGSVFHFTIRVGTHGGSPPSETLPLAGRRCLVVDDLPTSRDILTRQLRRLGAEADAAADGAEALGMLRASDVPYDLVLIDRAMPDMDGIALARAIRAEGTRRPRLVLCASGQIGAGRSGLELFDAQLLKPVLASRLRAMAAMLDSSVAPSSAEEEPLDTPLAGLDILLAEDNPINQLVTRSILVRAGASVDVVADGDGAVRAAGRRHYDVVLMDVQMPGMDGLEATRRIRRSEPPGKRHRIIGLTAAVGPEFERDCLQAGMDAYLGKPVGRDLLLNALTLVQQT